MPRKKTTQKKPQVEHALVCVKVVRYESRVSAGVSHHAYAPQYAWDLDDNDPLFEFSTELRISGLVTYPDDRAGNELELTVYGEAANSRRLNLKLQDVHVRDKNGSPQYRRYRGTEIPVYDPPEGIGIIEKVRGEASWTGWLRASPQFMTDCLMQLGQDHELFLGIQERKVARARWIQSVTLQTTDPAEE
ncbi:hypothetical protein [Nitratireductor sp.]|uniref:hypothetical protein n=1 Tax=Nitratireductor sp. TaxID=1872084 RepID=UPI00260D0758|nr:hypothetical protein [Nitratireductor sp.]MCV0381722.1 hypothetical protein [Nitratireductor sp.]